MRKTYEAVGLPKPDMRHRILLALKPGAMESHQLAARFGIAYSRELTRMVREGMVQMVGGKNGSEFSLTDAGRAACPRWRDVVRPCAVSANEFAPTGEVAA